MKALKDYSSFIQEISLKSAVCFENLIVYPLTAPVGYQKKCYYLDAAIKNNLILITEVSEGGQVNQLKVSNRGNAPVFMLDGEELIGAKQNRILNTTILIDKESEIFIPVSCVEAGRWRYHSTKFRTSDQVFYASGRREKNLDVNKSVQDNMTFSSNQGKIWNSIEEMSFKYKIRSDTKAMSEIFDSKKVDLDSYITNLPCNKEQNGMIVFINNRLIGCDIITDKKIFQAYYNKLLRSYVIDALYSKPMEKPKISPDEQVKQLWNSFSAAVTTTVKSVGMGNDLRIEEKDIIGSALEVNESIVHVSLFCLN